MAAIRCISACRAPSDFPEAGEAGTRLQDEHGASHGKACIFSCRPKHYSWAPSAARSASPAMRCRAQSSLSKVSLDSRQQYPGPKALLGDGGSQRQADVSASAGRHLGSGRPSMGHCLRSGQHPGVVPTGLKQILQPLLPQSNSRGWSAGWCRVTSHHSLRGATPLCCRLAQDQPHTKTACTATPCSPTVAAPHAC